MDPASAPTDDGAYRFCPACGCESDHGEDRCHHCGRLVRIPSQVWIWVVVIGGVLEASWAIVHSRSAIEIVASGVGAAALIGATAWILVGHLSRLNRRGGPSKALGAVVATLVTAVICLPIFTTMDRGDESTTFVFSVTMLLMPPLIGIPAGILLARGSRPHVPLSACERCRSYIAPDAGFCTGCGAPIDVEST